MYASKLEDKLGWELAGDEGACSFRFVLPTAPSRAISAGSFSSSGRETAWYNYRTDYAGEDREEQIDAGQVESARGHLGELLRAEVRRLGGDARRGARELLLLLAVWWWCCCCCCCFC